MEIKWEQVYDVISTHILFIFNDFFLRQPEVLPVIHVTLGNDFPPCPGYPSLHFPHSTASEACSMPLHEGTASDLYEAGCRGKID